MKQTKISVDDETHRLLKVYCAQHGFTMSQFISHLIRERINDECDTKLLTMQSRIYTKNEEA